MGNHLALWLAIVEMEATDVGVYGSQRCLALQHLCACFKHLRLSRAWATRFVSSSLLSANGQTRNSKQPPP